MEGELRGATLMRVSLECGHVRELYFFEDEGPLSMAMCISGECPPYAMRLIIASEEVRHG